MKPLQKLAQRNSHWTLDEFVKVVNEQLPQFLPTQKAHTRVREEVTPRLVRHYTSLGMLDEALKEGREARYIYRHLLQLLVIRRLLAEGYGASAINNLAILKDNSELEALLQGGIQLTVEPANPALGFLQQIKQRHGYSLPLIPNQTRQSPTYFATKNWRRIEILPGLEINIREDFIYPNSPQEQQNLLQAIAQQLLKLSMGSK
jgi:DNA-binding transcriptional MerR regulator